MNPPPSVWTDASLHEIKNKLGSSNAVHEARWRCLKDAVIQTTACLSATCELHQARVLFGVLLRNKCTKGDALGRLGTPVSLHHSARVLRAVRSSRGEFCWLHSHVHEVHCLRERGQRNEGTGESLDWPSQRRTQPALEGVHVPMWSLGL